jgi:NAD(P)-dependent dehydrogenase (short-subunit alcohol dehydrogenase family)
MIDSVTLVWDGRHRRRDDRALGAELTRATVADPLAEGIRVNCIHPGTADTP